MTTAENTKLTPAWAGTLQMTAGAVMLSFSAVFVKWAHVGPTASGFYRMFFGALILLGAVLIRKERLFHGSHHLKIVFICGLLFALDITLWHRSIHFIGPGLATLMANFQVFFLALFGMTILKEKSNWKFFVAVPTAVFGLYLIVAPNWKAMGDEYRAGVVLALVAAISYAGYILVLRNFQSKFSVSAFSTIGLIALITSAVLALEALVINESLVIPDLQSWVALLGYGLFSQVLAWVLISNGLPKIEASRAGLILLLQPTFSFVWDILFFNRPTTWLEVLGALMALFAIYMGVTAKKA
ncbi:MAG: DMT family transporter [Deltaproteobacteria bacterium]|nr:DMT family transporter [Deltaproteobacteria bacterium]